MSTINEKNTAEEKRRREALVEDLVDAIEKGVKRDPIGGTGAMDRAILALEGRYELLAMLPRDSRILIMHEAKTRYMTSVRLNKAKDERIGKANALLNRDIDLEQRR